MRQPHACICLQGTKRYLSMLQFSSVVKELRPLRRCGPTCTNLCDSVGKPSPIGIKDDASCKRSANTLQSAD